MAFAGLASNALLARLLTPQELGAYFLAYSIVALGAMVGSLGLAHAVVRFVAEGLGLDRPGRVRRVIGLVLGVGMLGALGTGLLYLVYGGRFTEWVFDAPALAAVTGLVAAWISVSIVQGILGEIFRGFHDVRLATILGGQVTGTVTGVMTVGMLAAALLLVWLFEGQASLATVVLLAVCSGGATTLVAGWVLARKVAGLTPGEKHEEQKGSPRAVLGEVFSLAWPLRNGDIWVLGAFLSQDQVAVYGAAARLVAMVTMSLIIVNAIVPPLIAEMYAQGRKAELERALRAVAMVTGIPAFLAAMACILFPAPILGLVYGDFYRGGAVVLALLSAGQLMSVWTGSCGLALQMTGHQTTMMVASIATSAATLAVMFAVVGTYGILGVAMVRFLGVTVQSAIIWLMARYKTGMWTHAGFSQLSWLVRGTG